MSIIFSDIDNIIVSHIFINDERRNYKILQNIYYAFGKSYFNNFIMICKKYCLEIMFDKYKINDIYIFLQKITHKNNPKFYDCYRKFYKEIGNPLISFRYLNNKARLIIKYLSLYHEYLIVYTNKEMSEMRGNNYSDIHDDVKYKNKPLEFRFLKQKKIHNLEYYDLVERKNNIYDSTFILKKDVYIYKRGATKEIFNIDCIKIT